MATTRTRLTAEQKILFDKKLSAEDKKTAISDYNENAQQAIDRINASGDFLKSNRINIILNKQISMDINPK